MTPNENLVKCSDCNKHLFKFIVYNKGSITYNLFGNCPFCDGKSFTHKANGQVSCSSINSDESLCPTIITDVVINGSELEVKVLKR